MFRSDGRYDNNGRRDYAGRILVFKRLGLTR
jgi:hypothetical protein